MYMLHVFVCSCTHLLKILHDAPQNVQVEWQTDDATGGRVLGEAAGTGGKGDGPVDEVTTPAWARLRSRKKRAHTHEEIHTHNTDSGRDVQVEVSEAEELECLRNILTRLLRRVVRIPQLN